MHRTLAADAWPAATLPVPALLGWPRKERRHRREAAWRESRSRWEEVAAAAAIADGLFSSCSGYPVLVVAASCFVPLVSG
uniref:Uncharacterized protein n=1 Tax=Arundo donax TaxID=35708 RepID=A0A0A9EIE7_ARUDO